MGENVRCISVDGRLSVMAVDSTDIVNEMARIHHTSPVASAALGRLLTATSMMGAVLKGEKDSVTVKIKGSGPIGSLLAVSDSQGNVRGYAQRPQIDLPLNSKGKLDVAGAVGQDASLTVIKDLNLKEPYIGQVPVQTGEIAEDITYYYYASEQIPTVCSLGVLVDRDYTIKKAGGFIIQMLPTAMDEDIDLVEECIKDVKPVTTMLMEGLTPEEICRKALYKFDLEVLSTSHPVYKCNCSRRRVENALLASGRESLIELAKEPVTEVCCQFCDKKYSFTPEDIYALLKSGGGI